MAPAPLLCVVCPHTPPLSAVDFGEFSVSESSTKSVLFLRSTVLPASVISTLRQSLLGWSVSFLHIRVFCGVVGVVSYGMGGVGWV